MGRQAQQAAVPGTLNPPDTQPDEALLAAWRQTDYQVDTAGGSLVLHIDEHSPGLAELMRAEGVDCAAYITADNPCSTVVSAAENAAARQRLEARLREGGWRWLPGMGFDPGGDHPGEHSLLVLGITPDDAVALAREFAQDAILGIGANASPRLLVTRPEANP